MRRLHLEVRVSVSRKLVNKMQEISLDKQVISSKNQAEAGIPAMLQIQSNVEQSLVIKNESHKWCKHTNTRTHCKKNVLNRFRFEPSLDVAHKAMDTEIQDESRRFVFACGKGLLTNEIKRWIDWNHKEHDKKKCFANRGGEEDEEEDDGKDDLGSNSDA